MGRMGTPRGDGEATKQQILLAIRRLFATQDISGVSIRDIAAESGYSHGLVQRYFGTREQMISEIIAQEIASYRAGPALAPLPVDAAHREEWRRDLSAGMTRFTEYAAIIARAELAGLRPEDLLDPDTANPAEQLADLIAQRQRQAGLVNPPDPRIVSASVNAILFAYATMAPWLLASVGLPGADPQSHLDGVIDCILDLIDAATRPIPE